MIWRGQTAGARLSQTSTRRHIARVLVCVASYRRPDQLRRLLESIRDSGPGGSGVEIIVVDNDPAGTAAVVMESFTTGTRYQLEPSPGIAQARNRALDEAAMFDALVFVDDDEWVGSGWLERLIDHANTRQVDVVSGPVITVIPPDAPKWIRRARFYQRPVLRTGSSLSAAATNNTLLRCSAWSGAGARRFDESFSSTGGSDAHFFHGLLRSGLVMEFCAEAAVYEDVPHERLTLTWLTRRAFRNGIVSSRIWRAEWPGWIVAARGLVMIVQGLGQVFPVAVSGGKGWAKPFNTVVGGLGVVASRLGLAVHEYART